MTASAKHFSRLESDYFLLACVLTRWTLATHAYRASRIAHWPLHGADVEGIEPDAKLEALVDNSFIDGNAWIKMSLAGGSGRARARSYMRMSPWRERCFSGAAGYEG